MAYRRLRLEPGQRVQLPLRLSADVFAYLDRTLPPIIETSWFTVEVGGSSAHLPLPLRLRVAAR